MGLTLSDMRLLVEGVRGQKKWGDYRSKDKQDLSKTIAMLEKRLKLVQTRYHNLNQLINEPGIEAHYSMAATNASRALRYAMKLIGAASTMLAEAENSWIEDRGRTENHLFDRAVGLVIAVENAIRGYR